MMKTASTSSALVHNDPRRSNALMIGNDIVQADGNTWYEKLAVCEASTDDGKPKMIIRSYYRNERTGERCWDEPPSGASKVKHATAEMRRMAQEQMQELQLTLEMIPPDTEEENANNNNKKSDKSSKRSGLFGVLFGRRKPKKTVEVSKDLNLQRAIARSMADQGGRSSYQEHQGGSSFNDPVNYYEIDSPSAGQNGTTRLEREAEEDDPDIALAKALSMSEVDSFAIPISSLTEEEMFQRALEVSRGETVGEVPSMLQTALLPLTTHAAMPEKESEDFDLSSSHISDTPVRFKKDPNESFSSLS